MFFWGGVLGWPLGEHYETVQIFVNDPSGQLRHLSQHQMTGKANCRKTDAGGEKLQNCQSKVQKCRMQDEKCKNVLQKNFSNSNNSTLSPDCWLAHWHIGTKSFLAQLVFFFVWRCGCGWCTHLKCEPHNNRADLKHVWTAQAPLLCESKRSQEGTNFWPQLYLAKPQEGKD